MCIADLPLVLSMIFLRVQGRGRGEGRRKIARVRVGSLWRVAVGVTNMPRVGEKKKGYLALLLIGNTLAIFRQIAAQRSLGK